MVLGIVQQLDHELTDVVVEPASRVRATAALSIGACVAAVLAAVLHWPALTHPVAAPAVAPRLSDQEAEDLLRQQSPPRRGASP